MKLLLELEATVLNEAQLGATYANFSDVSGIVTGLVRLADVGAMDRRPPAPRPLRQGEMEQGQRSSRQQPPRSAVLRMPLGDQRPPASTQEQSLPVAGTFV